MLWSGLEVWVRHSHIVICKERWLMVGIKREVSSRYGWWWVYGQCLMNCVWLSCSTHSGHILCSATPLIMSLSPHRFCRHTLHPFCVPSILLRHNLLLSGNSCSVLSTTLWFIFAPRETFLSLEVLKCLLLPLPSPLTLSLFYCLFFWYKAIFEDENRKTEYAL